jgi:hypothetical protein
MNIMGILFKPKPKEVFFEELERKICLDKFKFGILIKVKVNELNPHDFFELFPRTKAQSFSRFYFTSEDPIKTHFAPSLDHAISWFKGKDSPRDGYGNICWGDYVKYPCKLCRVKKQFHLDLLGTGVPTKYIRENKTVPVIKWDSGKNQYLCQNCAKKLEEIDSEQKLDDYVIFDVD